MSRAYFSIYQIFYRIFLALVFGVSFTVFKISKLLAAPFVDVTFYSSAENSAACYNWCTGLGASSGKIFSAWIVGGVNDRWESFCGCYNDEEPSCECPYHDNSQDQPGARWRRPSINYGDVYCSQNCCNPYDVHIGTQRFEEDYVACADTQYILNASVYSCINVNNNYVYTPAPSVYKCGQNYWGTPVSCGGGCSPCPSLFNVPGSNSMVSGATTPINNCFIPSGVDINDGIGTFKFTGNACFYS